MIGYLFGSVIAAGFLAVFVLAFRNSRNGRLSSDDWSLLSGAVIAAPNLTLLALALWNVIPHRLRLLFSATVGAVALLCLVIIGYRKGWGRSARQHVVIRITNQGQSSWGFTTRVSSRAYGAVRRFLTYLRPIVRQRGGQVVRFTGRWSSKGFHWTIQRLRPAPGKIRVNFAKGYLIVITLMMGYLAVRGLLGACVTTVWLIRRWYWKSDFWNYAIWHSADEPFSLRWVKLAFLAIGIVLLLWILGEFRSRKPKVFWWIVGVPLIGAVIVLIAQQVWFTYSTLAVWEFVPWVSAKDYPWIFRAGQIVVLLIAGGLLFESFRGLRKKNGLKKARSRKVIRRRQGSARKR